MTELKSEAALNKKAKNIAAIVYLLLLTFLVGGSYINQHKNPAPAAPAAGAE
ncbi:MAG: hypothetical protein ABSB19_06745 [Methylomonas sp.]|jgi:hypothetical protein